MAFIQQKKQQRPLLSQINVTPFVDVMLVLLIIFMVTAPMLQQGIDISLPKTKTTGSIVPEKSFILKIQKNKKIYIGSKSIKMKDLTTKLQAIFEHKKTKALYLQSDRTVPYGFVAQTLAIIRSSGIHNVSLITNTK